MVENYESFYRRSIDDRDAFWREQAQLIDWREPFTQVCDDTRPPFLRWFVGGPPHPRPTPLPPPPPLHPPTLSPPPPPHPHD